MNIDDDSNKNFSKPLLFTGFIPPKVLKVMLVLALIISVWFLFSVFVGYKKISERNTAKFYISREVELNRVISDIQQQNSLLETEILILNNKLMKLINKKQHEQINKISLLLGSKEYIGEGIEIILQDSPKYVQNEDMRKSVIHNIDILELVNALWDLGAKAIAINDVRVVFNTEISCIGPTIMVGKKIITPPFYIQAVGNVKKLEKISENSTALVLKYNGMEFLLEKKDNIIIPATKSSLLGKEE